MENESLPCNYLEGFDVHLQEFYHRVVFRETDLKFKPNVHGVNKALNEVVTAYKKDAENRFINYDGPWKRCAYVIKHSTCFTSAVASYLLRLIHHKKIKENIWGSLKEGRLNICCLGGGPATDAVAVIKIARGLYHTQWVRTGLKLAVHVSVVDLSEDWHETAKNVFHCLQETPEIFGEGELTLTYEFIQADLSQEMQRDVIDVIRSADIITLIYFVSAVYGNKGEECTFPMMKNIMQHMKKGAFFIFLDSAADHNYDVLNQAAEKCRSMIEIYGPLVEEFHTISLDSVRKFIELYSKYFRRFFCMTNIFLCVSSWYKMKNIAQRLVLRKDLTKERAQWTTPSEEESENSTEKMLQYRAKVKRLVKETYYK